MSLAVRTSLLTAGPFSQHFHIQSFQLLIFICQKLMHSQAWRQPVKCRTIYNARSVHASAGLVLLLPCHLDEVSLQTHGRSLFLKAPTMHPVCSVETEKRPKCLRECKILLVFFFFLSSFSHKWLQLQFNVSFNSSIYLKATQWNGFSPL